MTMLLEQKLSDSEVKSKLRILYIELREKHNFNYSGFLEIKISNRLRSSNGYYQVILSPFSREIKKAKIVMSRALLDEFDWDRFEKTFRHEVAHFADFILNKNNGHGESFKKLCREFGGTMNPSMAGKKYADCASNDFVETIKRWSYKCPCGAERLMARRMNESKRSSTSYRCIKCKTTLNLWVETQLV